MALPNYASRDLLEALTSGALVVAADSQKVLYANPQLQALTGLALDEILRRPLNELLILPPKTDCPFCGAAGKDCTPVHAAFLSTAAAEETRVKVKHSCLPGGEALLLVDLYSEDTALTQAHSDFVSTVSHEFRTPLTSIKGFAETLLKYGSQLPEDQQRRFIHIIKEQADRLIRLVENLLTVSKLGARRMEMSYRPIAVQRLVEKVVQNLQAKSGGSEALERQFVIDMHPALPELWADADRLEQVLINLIDNAVKYSGKGSEVRITGSPMPDDDARLMLQVSDQGVGIPPELLPQIFSKFYRIEGPLTRQVEGTGLGLYITKSLTTAMEGEIRVESMPGHGTTFTLIFPVATAERQAAHRRRLYAEDAVL